MGKIELYSRNSRNRMIVGVEQRTQQNWTIAAILQWTKEAFVKRGIDSARLDAELLLAAVLKVDRIYLYTHFDKPLSTEERALFRHLVKRRAALEPVAYLLGEREFYGRRFVVDKRVLIPRPETEHLIDYALTWCTQNFTGEKLSILDIGTGSGCIAITLAAELQAKQFKYSPSATNGTAGAGAGAGIEIEIVATDISQGALALAQENAALLGVQDVIQFMQGDLFAALKPSHTDMQAVVTPSFDLIISNPPYVENTCKETMQRDVLLYEPEDALFSGEDGLVCLRQLCAEVQDHLKPGGLFLCEFGASQGLAVKQLLAQSGEWETLTILKDLAGHDRGIAGVKG